MKLKTLKIGFIVLAAMLMFSCSPKIVGEWNISKYEIAKPGEQGIALNNIGTIIFHKNGSGEKNINYTALGVTHTDKNPFKWTSQDEKFITIKGKDTELDKTWIIITSKGKHQVWHTTDGSNTVQTLELTK